MSDFLKLTGVIDNTAVYIQPSSIMTMEAINRDGMFHHTFIVTQVSEASVLETPMMIMKMMNVGFYEQKDLENDTDLHKT
jgi:hypothetical protein